MKFNSKIKVKICCISSFEEAQLAIDNGASALGLVSKMPSGPGIISENKIKEITCLVPPPIATFLLTSKQNAKSIIQQQKKTKVNTIQLVDEVQVDELKLLRKNLNGIKLVQVIHVHDENSILEAIKIEKLVDALLLDSGNPKLKVKELGGTGRIHNWKISRKIVDEVSIPVFLAGGLNETNVINAIEQVQPFGLDLCNGVRTNYKLDESKLKILFSKIDSFYK